MGGVGFLMRVIVFLQHFRNCDIPQCKSLETDGFQCKEWSMGLTYSCCLICPWHLLIASYFIFSFPHSQNELVVSFMYTINLNLSVLEIGENILSKWKWYVCEAHKSQWVKG